VSRLVAGVREATGHPSGPQIIADTGMTVDTSRPHVPDTGCPDGGRFRKQRTVNPLIALCK
jgi:hypothetical protein